VKAKLLDIFSVERLNEFSNLISLNFIYLIISVISLIVSIKLIRKLFKG